MAKATQAEVRSWARAKGMTVNDRGSLPAKVVEAYLAAHGTKAAASARPARKKAARVTAKATSLPRARKAARKAGRKAAAKSTRRAAAPVARAVATPAVKASPAGSADLAGGLRSYLGAIDAEVREVSTLSERIDGLVQELNDLRDQQAKRLLVLDALRGSVSDQSLGAFLDQAIKPRKTRVPEVIPARLK